MKIGSRQPLDVILAREQLPLQLANVCDVIETTLRREGFGDTDAALYARDIVLALSISLGGQQLCFPVPKNLRLRCYDALDPRLLELCDLIEPVLADGYEGSRSLEEICSCVVVAIAHYYGGRQVYWATADRMKKVLRDAEIYSVFVGAKGKQNKKPGDVVGELSKKHGITVIHTYRIIREQRAKLQHKRAAHRKAGAK